MLPTQMLVVLPHSSRWHHVPRCRRGEVLFFSFFSSGLTLMLAYRMRHLSSTQGLYLRDTWHMAEKKKMLTGAQVKCDERPGICLNCERLHLECQRADGSKAAPAAAELSKSSSYSPSTPLGEVGIKRKRTFRSCVQCRASKARCSGQKPSCDRCIQRGVDCVYDEDSAPQWTRVVQQPDAPTYTSPSVSDGTNQLKDDATGSHQILSEGVDESPTQISMSIETPVNTAATPPTSTSAAHPTITLRRSVSARNLGASEGPDSLDWYLELLPRFTVKFLTPIRLFRPQLPNRQRVRILAKEYFENIHPLRCYAFIHRPSFIQRLDESSNDDHSRNALLHVVCALGAK